MKIREEKKRLNVVEREKNDQIQRPEFPEVYHLLDEMADKLYLFLSRDEI